MFVRQSVRVNPAAMMVAAEPVVAALTRFVPMVYVQDLVLTRVTHSANSVVRFAESLVVIVQQEIHAKRVFVCLIAVYLPVRGVT